MFHTYITAKSGRRIDIDRAMLVMDNGLFYAAHADIVRRLMRRAVVKTRSKRAAHRIAGPDSIAQLVWSEYCRRHAEKYCAEFEPDVSSTWDS